ncbi:MAG: sulfate permease [Rikenellaceae bacterium]
MSEDSSKWSAYTPQLLKSLRGYNRETFMRDLMAGVIVGIVALPMSIAFGIASGVTPEVGLVTAIIGGFIVAALGGSTVQASGPTGAFIVVVYGIIAQFGLQGLMLATLLAGIMLVLMGLLRLGTIIKFIPYPIIVGFTSGIALTIFSTQMSDLFGLSISSLPADFIGKWVVYGSNIGSVNYMAMAYGILTIAIIIFTPKITRKVPGSLIAVVGVTLLAYVVEEFIPGLPSIETIGDRFTINAAIPAPQWLDIDFSMIQRVLPAAFTIALLGAIESLLSATVADGVTGDRHNSNTELMAQGAANIVVPFFGGIPVTGAIARTMTCINNGGRTPVAAIIHAVTLLLILLFLGDLTQHIPMACLAGVLVMVAYNMSEWRTFRALMRGSRSDIAVLLATFLLTVIFDLTVAIMIGLLLAMLLFMRRMAEVTEVSVVRSSLSLEEEGENDKETLEIPDGVDVYQIDGPFFFGIANKLDAVMEWIGDEPKVRIIRMRRIPFMDSTGLHNLETLIKISQEGGIKVILSGVNAKVNRSLVRSKINTLLGDENICPDIYTALELSKRYL